MCSIHAAMISASGQKFGQHNIQGSVSTKLPALCVKVSQQSVPQGSPLVSITVSEQGLQPKGMSSKTSNQSSQSRVSEQGVQPDSPAVGVNQSAQPDFS
jgi:hypothetical protein